MDQLVLLRIKRWFTLPRIVVIAVVALVVYIIFHDTSESERWYNRPAPCKKSPEVLHDMIDIAERIHKVLDVLKIQHFLCYGSLWGTLRNQQMLPWDDDVDFCILNEDVKSVEEAFMMKTFRSYGMTLTYDARHGLYRVTYKNGVVELVVFQLSEDYGSLKRVGWESKLFMEKPTAKFPSRLAAPPLPTMKMNGIDLPIPHEEIEIQKYMYPDDWWKEMKPPNC